MRFVNSRPFFQCDPRTEETHANKRLRTFASYWRFSPRPGPFGRGSDSPLIGFLDESVAEGRVFARELDVQCFLDRWVGEVADRQTDPDGIEAPIERFLRAEASALQPIAGRSPFATGGLYPRACGAPDGISGTERINGSASPSGSSNAQWRRTTDESARYVWSLHVRESKLGPALRRRAAA